MNTTPKADELLSTFAQAEQVNPYELARRWADVASRPVPVPADVARAKGIEVRTLAHDLDELATGAALQKWLSRWLVVSIHQSLLAGGTLDQVAAAAGLTPADTAAAWREWSAGQRRLQASMPDLPDHSADYDRVESLLAEALGETPINQTKD